MRDGALNLTATNSLLRQGQNGEPKKRLLEPSNLIGSRFVRGSGFVGWCSFLI
jgi:hypothetical protein